MTKPTDQEALTYNWDTVFALPASIVNNAIIKKKSSPSRFKYSFTPEGSTIESTVSANFGDWLITQGGDGKNLRMSVPLNTIAVLSGTEVPTFLGSANAVIEIKLHYVPHTDAPSPKSGKLMKLVPKNILESPTDPVVTLVGEIKYQNPPGIVEKAVFEIGFRDWINANLAEFDHIFAVININDKIDSDAQWAFTKPTYTSYAFIDRDTLEDSVFGVLCMTGGRSGEKFTEQISPNAIPASSKAGFLISQRRFLDDLVKPALKLSYNGLTEDKLSISSDGTSLSLKIGETVQLKDVSHDGNKYSPLLKEFEITALGQTLKIYSHTKTEVSSGIYSISKATHWYNIKLGTKSNGKQTLKYSESQKAKITHETEKSVGVEIGEIIAGILTAIVVVIAGILTDGAAFVAAAAVIGLLGGMAAATPSIIAAANKDDSPDIDMLVINTTDPITWPDSKDFLLEYAGLNVSLQLGGNPQFA